MPIRSMSPEELEQQCGSCNAMHIISIESLVLGVSNGIGADQVQSSEAIALPPCTCGSVEFLMRTFDHSRTADADAPYVLHRRLVNALAQHLKNEGLVHPNLEAVILGDTRTSVDIAVELSGTVPPLFAPPEGG